MAIKTSSSSQEAEEKFAPITALYHITSFTCFHDNWIFTFSRYVAICKPFLSHTMSKLSRAYKFILVSVFRFSSSQLAASNPLSKQWITNVPPMFLGYLDDFDLSRCTAGKSLVDWQINFDRINYPFSFTSTIFQTLFTLHLDEMYSICVPKQDYNHLFVVSTFLLFVIPMSIITILYILIGLQLRKSKIVQRGAVNGSSVRLKVSHH